jgi:tetratricopeptide (TPR) repeat protein
LTKQVTIKVTARSRNCFVDDAQSREEIVRVRENVGSFSRVRHAVLLCCIGFLLSAFPAVALDPACADDPEDYDVAIAACTAALAETEAPEDKARLLTQRAELQRRTGDMGEAASSIDEATRLAPGLADAWIEKGYLENALGNPEGALDAHTRARDAEPDYWRPVLVRLDTLANMGLYQECLEDAVRAVELAPERPHTYAYRGRCHYETGELDAAIADYEMAVEMGLGLPAQ